MLKTFFSHKKLFHHNRSNLRSHTSHNVILICLALIAVFILPCLAHAYLEKPDVVIEKTCGEENTDAPKILVAYDTKYGSTATVAERIGDVLCEEGFRVDIRLARHVPTEELDGYDAAIIGSAIIMEKWLPGALKLLKKGESILAGKQVAYFIVCMSMRDESEESVARVTEHYIQPILEEFPGISPAVDAGKFAGVADYETMYPVDRFLMKLIGAEEGDWRNFDKVGAWAIEFGTNIVR
jgi:menaquinone-dependent protoporphyrinogen oxidase